ncbi:hypothetical protein MMC18_000506 [Xylographa bjoerkii]|nr:hypothetical protein [Xylographa bjoerkii]
MQCPSEKDLSTLGCVNAETLHIAMSSTSLLSSHRLGIKVRGTRHWLWASLTSTEPVDHSLPESSESKPNTNGELPYDEMKQMMLRTIKKGRGGPMVTTLGRGAVASRAVQEAIG